MAVQRAVETDWLTAGVLLFWPYRQVHQCHLLNYSVLWDPSKTMSTDAAQYTADCYRVASPRITRLDSERNLTPTPNYKLSSAPRWHLSTVIVLCLGDGATITRPFLCRAPLKQGLLRLSWWGQSSRAPTLLWRERRGSALPLSPSVLTESCRSCSRWQVLLLPKAIRLSCWCSSSLW